MKLTQDDLMQAFFYNPDSGIFLNRTNRGARAAAGTRAGSYMKDGYRRLKVGGRFILEHRAAWLIAYGELPPDQIDHINGVPDDNRIANLRAATNAENQQNLPRRRDTKSGVTGVNWNPAKRKWQARIGVGRGRIFLGYFGSVEAAAAAYAGAKKRVHVFSPELRGHPNA